MIIEMANIQAKYIVATSATCQAVWLKKLVVDFNKKQDGATR